MKTVFLQSNRKNHNNLWKEVSENFYKCSQSKEDFQVEFSKFEESKSWEQIKGIHRLCDLLALRFTEANGFKYTKDVAKSWVKREFGFTRKPTDSEALHRALERKAELVAIGSRFTRESFVSLIREIKRSHKEERSFKTATKEEMMYLISKIEEFASQQDWHEIKLTNEEERSLLTFYNNLNNNNPLPLA